MSSPLEILNKYWNYPTFRDPQEEIIETVLQKKDTVVLLPTSGGKSICYQIPAILLEGVCVVISPLIALIEDQVNNLNKRNIKAIALTSQLNEEEIIIAFDNLQFGGYKFLYLSPEKLQSQLIQDKIKQLNVNLFAIDEAHCISEWGHDFRPSYLKLTILKELHPNAITIALTATATARVLEDIQKNLNLKNAAVFKNSFQRNNLSYHVIKTQDIYGKLLQLLKRTSESVIIYTNNRKQTKEISQILSRNNLRSSYYHGGLSAIEKKDSFNSWMQNETPIMVATNAFGMGIDKENVEVVIHIHIPNSLENYIQEAGRAGRNGKNAFAILLYNQSVLYETEQKFKSNLATTPLVKQVYNKLNQFYNIALGEIPSTTFKFSLQEFCAQYKLNLLQTYNAIKTLEREEIIGLDENYRKKSTIKFIVNNTVLFEFLKSNPSKNDLIQLLLRSYGGIFQHYTIINEYVLSKKLKCSQATVISDLNYLHKTKIVDYEYANTASKLTFLVTREDNYTINRISKNIEQQNSLKTEKLEAAINYVCNKKECRNTQLLTYFSEHPTKNCGKCDVCKAKKSVQSSTSTVAESILSKLKVGEKTSNELEEVLGFKKEEILISLKILLEQNKITITSRNKYKLTTS